MFYLQLRNELWKLFGKKRTYIGFGFLLLAQIIIILTFRFTPWSHKMTSLLEKNGYIARDFMSSVTVATVMVYPIAFLLMPLYVTLIGGDLVAKEAEDGTLRMILARPISRFRLLLVKWVAGTIFAFLLIIALGLLGFLFASLWFPKGGLFAFIPGEIFSVFDPAVGMRRYVLAHFFLAIKAATLMGLGFMFSCFNIKPAAATILALSVLFGNGVMQMIPFLKEYEHWFFVYYLNSVWLPVLNEPIPWWKIGQSLSVLLGFNLTFLIIGLTAFQVRDIKS
jgi:ABC-2 type transport system permease protein